LFSVLHFPFVTFNGILTSYEKFIALKLADVLYRIFNVGFTVVALLLGMGLYALVSVHAIVGLLTILFKFIVIKKSVPVGVDFKNTEKGVYKEILSFSIWATVASLAQRLVFNIMPTILGIVATTASIAVFGIVTTIEGYSYTFATAINGMFMPKVSRIIANKTADEELTSLAISVGKFQFALNGLIVVGFALVGKSFITLWMGEAYSDAYLGILLVIAPGLIINSLQIANTTMTVLKKVKEQAVIMVIVGIVNVLLAFPLAKFFGVIGACFAICIAYVVRAIVSIIVYQRCLPISMGKFVKNCFLRMSISLLLTLCLGFGVNFLIQDGGWLILGLKILVITTIYLLLVVFTGFNTNERRQVFNKFLKRKQSKSVSEEVVQDQQVEQDDEQGEKQ
jgi:O-antigen/teichoic acid export membrane protein